MSKQESRSDRLEAAEGASDERTPTTQRSHGPYPAGHVKPTAHKGEGKYG